MTAIKSKIGGMNRVYVKGRWWSWNTAYEVYNAEDNYDQLTTYHFKMRVR